MPNAVELIIKKRDKKRLSSEEISWLVREFTAGRVPDYQMSAWLMAVMFSGLSGAETSALTDAMLHSGQVLRLESVRRPKIDKHSTGGVGDKVSLCLAPLVAACGVAVPMMSGRGLGHTGGTLDKLESIPGYRVSLSPRQFEKVVRSVGVSIIGQTDELAPADRKIYGLRDVTGTVESVSLITASILSKKLAEGADALVFDVKAGRGAFMKDVAQARALAKSLVTIASRAGTRAVALVTDMSAPLGLAIGNALEMREAIDVLKGGGPPEVVELTLLLGAEMLVLAGRARGAASARAELRRALESSAGLERLEKMVRAHGGDDRVIRDPRRLPRARHRIEVPSKRAGYVRACDPLELGMVAVALGAGRTRADESVDPAVGVELNVSVGSPIAAEEPLAWLHAQNRRDLEPLTERTRRAFRIGTRSPAPRKLVLSRVSG
ncbi:MAG TPA: thymidine phosphorylase [Polyangiaceae bacterium]|jgi:pyrimidine-nucleoside phosphorylase